MADKKLVSHLDISTDIYASDIYIIDSIYKNNELYITSNWIKENNNIISYTKGNVVTDNLISVNISSSNLKAQTYRSSNIELSGSIGVQQNVSATNYTTNNLGTANISTSTLHSNIYLGTNLDVSNSTVNSLIALSLTSGTIYSDIYNGNNWSVSTITSTNLLSNNSTISNILISGNFISNSLHTTNATITNLEVTNVSTNNIYLTGDIYKNNNIIEFSEWSKTNNDIFYTKGNVGINTSNPMYDLDVNGTIIADILRTKEVDTITNSIIFNGNNIGIGTSSPSYKLHVEGDVYASGDIIVASDESLKTDINRITDAMSMLNKLTGVYFYKNSTKRNVGFIAQEVEDVIPDLVSDVGEYKGIKYNNMIALIVEAIKELDYNISQIENSI